MGSLVNGLQSLTAGTTRILKSLLAFGAGRLYCQAIKLEWQSQSQGSVDAIVVLSV